MFSTPMLLDAARKASGIPSDYRLARVICVADHTLYNYRHGGRTPADEHVMKLAELAKLDVGFVLLCMCYERAKTPERKAAIFYSLRRYAAHLGLSDLLILPGPQMSFDEPQTLMNAAISRNDQQLDGLYIVENKCT
jgi:hypothetical protein